MRTISLAAGAALAVAVLGSAGEAAAQNEPRFGYCYAYPWSLATISGRQRANAGEYIVFTSVFRFESLLQDDKQADAAVEQAWSANVRSAGLVAGRPGYGCETHYRSLERANAGRASEEAQWVRWQVPVRTSAWQPDRAAPAASRPVAQPAPALPSLVVRESDADERARQLNEENARRNREAAERDAANRARYEQQQRDHEAAMARHRAAQERYRRECERVRAQGGSCVISR